ncbi:hypothetical protein [Gordonia liuliyuniae]|nr:hypothetical protein [Gordonia liuliyuniae]
MASRYQTIAFAHFRGNRHAVVSDDAHLLERLRHVDDGVISA